MTKKHTLPRRIQPSPLVRLVRMLGSVYLAVVLIAALAVILTLSTSLESLKGTTFAQRLFYQAGWFDVFLAFLGINILCATLTRWPFKIKHTGFIIVHIGILMLLAGSLLSRLLAQEGQILLYEGEKLNEMFLNSYEVGLHRGGSVTTVALPRRAGGAALLSLPDGKRIVLAEILDRAVEKEEVTEGAPAAPANAAARLELSSGMMGFAESFWLIERHPDDPHASRAEIGPAVAELRDRPRPAETPRETVETPRLVFSKQGKRVAETDLFLEKDKDVIPVGDTGYKLENIRYFADARVGEGNKLINASEEPLNPAVGFELVAPDGARTRVIRFALFPEFESMHGGTAAKDFEIAFLAPGARPRGNDGPNRPTLTLYHTGGTWNYQFVSSKTGATPEPPRAVRAGEELPAGWMDFRLRIESLFERAVVTRRVVPGSEKKGQVGARLSLVDAGGKVLDSSWAVGERPAALDAAGKDPVFAALRQATAPVPFTLTLEDFRKVDYPGTNRPASYESDVVLHDATEHFEIRKTIKMNQPLDHRGFRIFQSSYIEDQGQGEASVFTVAKNPGIPLIYSGACVLFLGAFLVFFVPRFSSLLNRSEK